MNFFKRYEKFATEKDVLALQAENQRFMDASAIFAERILARVVTLEDKIRELERSKLAR